MTEEDPIMGATNPTTAVVLFDVGGVPFKVSRTLIEAFPDTMLAKICSETWQTEEHVDKPIFIDRDGEKFRLVLDFMRDNKVTLPTAVPRETFLLELGYYGLPLDHATLGQVTYAQNAIAKNVKLAREGLEEAQVLWVHKQCAHYCFKFYSETEQGSLDFNMVPGSDLTAKLAIQVLHHRYNETLFRACLANYGLRLESLDERSVDRYRGKLGVLD